MLPLSSKVQAQTQQAPPQPAVAVNLADPFWAVVGQYGIGIAALLAILKAYADYQLKAAMEERALKSKYAENDLAREDRMYNSTITQNESFSTNQGQLLNTFITKAITQAESADKQVSELINNITVLTEAIKDLSDSQLEQKIAIIELKDRLEALMTLEKEALSICTLLAGSLQKTMILNQPNATISSGG